MPITDLIPWNRNRNMPAARQTDPFVAFRREMDRAFDSFFRGFDLPMTGNPGWSVGTWPHVEVSETDNEVKLVAELPGMEEKDVELTLNEGRLTLKGEKKTETDGAVYSERWHGQFERTVQRPCHGNYRRSGGASSIGFHAAKTASCHCAAASALKTRSVDRETRWR
jgi:HSP20 family protein